MRALNDIAYDLFGYGAVPTAEVIAELSAACPGHLEDDYKNVLERVAALGKCADGFCNDWHDRVYTESEAMEKIRAACPGFAETSYRGAWNRALTIVHR